MPPERRYAAGDLRRFLTAVDARLAAPATITLLGGSAIALYGVAAATMDIDTWETDLAPLQTAIAGARAATGLDVSVVPAAVADVPYNAGDRLEREAATWTRLRVFKLEPHDLALSKAVRANDHDLVGIEELHRVVYLDRDVLISRYLEEMDHAIGHRPRLDANFVLLIERLFGEVEAERVEEMVRSYRKRRPTIPR